MPSVSLYSTVTLGRLEPLLDASFEVAEALGGSLVVTVQASPSRMSNEEVESYYDDLRGLDGALIPVLFSDKAFLSGFFRVSKVDLSHWSYPGNIGRRQVVLTAKVGLDRVGVDTDVDFESRLSGAQTRSNVYSLTGRRWHVAPAGHFGYSVAGTVPTQLTLTGEDGPVTLYTNFTVGANPRWMCRVEDYGRYRTRFIDATGRERSGTHIRLAPAGWPIGPSGWQVHNGLVRVRHDANGLFVAVHDGTKWAEKRYWLYADTAVSAVPLGSPDALSVIRNEYEAVTVRLGWTGPPSAGRVEVDLTVRRGARWVEGYFKSTYFSLKQVAKAAAEASTASSGYIAATAGDANGQRYILGAAGSFAGNTSLNTIASSTFALDFMIGAVVSGAPSGDLATDLMARYLGTTAERVEAVPR